MIQDKIQEYLDEADVAEGTLQTYKVYLRYFAEHFEAQGIDPKTMTKAQLRAWLSNPKWSANTRRIALCAVRGFLRAQFGKKQEIGTRIPRLFAQYSDFFYVFLL